MSREKILCTLGKFDIPIIQMQPTFIVDLLDSNLILFGSAMSGKTTFIKNLVNILHKQYDEDQEQIANFVKLFRACNFIHRNVIFIHSVYFYHIISVIFCHYCSSILYIGYTTM